ncbi:Retrovirus-related Pol polyprotein from transposon TNT 1-94 [Vitis vinifera]|uniref:Retrovirus-related Pol polyprotein from transposon TNT 1-94 n=1 Tax=Vitis vinifera TaxID=29760 RepID=A0A438IW03_VITVI|nr:Retrovirus-related Pol polyprotein from transposon TNT 1-94 [Vitis vinifera]
MPPSRSTTTTTFNPDRKTLASMHGDHTVKIIDCHTRGCLKVLTSHRRTPWVVRSHPVHPEILASGSLDYEVHIWDANTAECIGSRDFYHPIASIAFHAKGELLVVASRHKLYVQHYSRRWETSSPTIILKIRRSLRVVVMKDPEDIAAYRKSIEQQWVHIFLVGLDGLIKTSHPKTDPNIDKSTFKCTHCNKAGHTKSRCFEIVGYPDWWDHNSDQRKKDSKKTLTIVVAKIKTEANVAEKASALVAATVYGTNGNITPVIGEGPLTLTDTLNLDYVLVVPYLDYNLLMTWLCLMKTKDEVNLLFQNFHKMIETQYNAKVWVLRSDNGGEYQTKIPISYWGEAITSAAYLINRVPSTSINFQTPLQALSNAVVAPTVPNLPPRVFGCMAFVHLHKHQRTKLTSRALQCVFVGYALHKKGYRCYHPPTRRMFITMDVDKSGQSELVNQEAGELDMSGTTLEPSSNDHTKTEEVIKEGRDSRIEPSSERFGFEDVFTEIPNQSLSVEGVLNLEPGPFMKWLPHRHNRAIHNSVQEALANPRWKIAMNEEMKSL